MSTRAKELLWREFERWGFDTRGWAPTTRRKYLLEVQAADRWLTEHRHTSVTYATVADLQAFLFSTVPHARTRNRKRQALMAFGDFTLDQGLVQINAALGLPRLPEPQNLPKALSKNTAARIAQAAPFFGAMQEVLILVMLYGGLRKGEARLLEWSMVDDGWLRFRGKRSRQRTVPLHPVLADAVRRWKAKASDPRWVFPSPRLNGHPVSDTYIRLLVYQVGDMVGEHLHPHLFRHTAATRMLEVGANLREVQEFLGHASPTTTSIYTRVRPALLKEAVERLDFRP